MELEECLLIKFYLENVKKNGCGKEIMVHGMLQNQITINLPLIKPKLKDLPRDMNGMQITGICLETKITIRLWLLFRQTKQHQLLNNKKLSHS
jgi:hypothetical protein